MDRDHEPKMLMAFISRHEPTPRQIELAAAVVHPAAALRLAPDFFVGVFQNANRAPVGQPPQFEAVALHVFNLMD